jgi:aminopeptidase N
VLNRVIPVDVKSVVVSTAISEGDEREWKFAFDRYTKSNLAQEKDMLLSALTSTRKHNILKQ